MSDLISLISIICRLYFLESILFTTWNNTSSLSLLQFASSFYGGLFMQIETKLWLGIKSTGLISRSERNKWIKCGSIVTVLEHKRNLKVLLQWIRDIFRVAPNSAACWLVITVSVWTHRAEKPINILQETFFKNFEFLRWQ